MLVMLFIVSTPIGNLKDITHRALDVLKSADIIAAEDTRRSRILLKSYGIGTRMVSYNDKNKTRRTKHLLGLLLDGRDIAIISDAGTPGINDPAFYLVREAIKLAMLNGQATLYEPQQVLQIESPSEFLGELSKLVQKYGNQLKVFQMRKY